ncbi:MAG: hypothetical protein LBE67_14965 [Kocuria palustris]|nr:hypothetical protein [Kocuria palustris]
MTLLVSRAAGPAASRGRAESRWGPQQICLTAFMTIFAVRFSHLDRPDPLDAERVIEQWPPTGGTWL